MTNVTNSAPARLPAIRTLWGRIGLIGAAASVVPALTSAALAQRLGAADRAEVTKAVSDEDAEIVSGFAQRWRGSYITLDQSTTTQTLRLGADFQSYDPVYEFWLSAKPQFYVLDRKRHKVSVGLWMNAFLELTNSASTTRQREVVLGPTFLLIPYLYIFKHGIWDRPGYKTAISIGPRIVLPTDKASWNSGQYINPGLAANLSQGVPLRGDSARFWQGAQFTLGMAVGAPVTRATTPVDPDLRRIRQDVGGRLVESDQLRGQMNTKAYLNVSLASDVQVSRRWAVAASYVLLNSWAYRPSNDPLCTLATGCVQPIGEADSPRFRVSTWLTASVTYELSKMVGLSLGYYNRASQLGLDGQRRNPFWSPEARLFFSVTGTLPN